MKRSFIHIFLLFLSISAIAQQADSNERRSLSNFFNLGINAGLGGDRIYYTVPTINGKLGPFYGNYSTTLGSNFNYSFTLGVDIIEIGKKRTSSQTCLTFSAGASNFKNPCNSDINYYNVSVLAGINRYMNNRHISYSFKVGAVETIKREFLGVTERQYGGGSIYYYGNYNYSQRYLPYGEVTIGLNVLRHKKNPATLLRPMIDGFSIDNTDVEYKMPVLSGEVRKYFNPYVSFGVGGDRIGVYPTVGFESKWFFVDAVSGKAFSNYDRDWAINFGYKFKASEWQDFKVTPSVSIHRQNRMYTQRVSIPQGFNYLVKSGYKQTSTTAILAGVSIAPKRISSLLRAQVGLGKLDEDRSTKINDVIVEEETNNSIKYKPVIGLSLVIKMFKDMD